MAKVFVGIDPSATSTGLAFIEIVKGKPTLTSVQTIHVEGTGLRRANRIAQIIAKTVGGLHAKNELGCIAIEGYSLGSKFQLATLVEVGTMVRYELWKKGYDVLIAPPSTLKMFATGKGNAKKPLVMLEAHKRWGFDLSQDDKCDAACLAVMAAAHAGDYTDLIAHQRKAIGTMTSL
jgi:crossover junction endodeoxyribonuclease RuvC